MLELRNITKVYNPGTVTEMCLFDKFNLTIGDKEFLSIVGSNGSGKTSLLNIICGSIPIEGGEVLIGGESIDRLKEHQRYRKMGRVYQNPAVGTCPNLTLLENMSLADNKGRPFNLGTGINKARVPYYKEQLSMLGLGLENKLNEKVGSLSGGQRQAVALIMSTLTPIDFLILDEHTAALDPKTAETIMQLTAKVIKEKQITAMMVTHNLRYAVEYGSRLIMMDNGQIVLEKTGSEKEKLTVDDILKVFTDISIECGN
ncbi:MAG TPA: ATP-binding cassette domain-containing protein [Bacillota bacterium]|nr:ATP-binding cassette domain-containing protein [Bacillota bacterium]HOH10033.1 ATP-binding cassette domain-containing protein [Bacillota bacterium]HOY89707.1 ATP-binding cassette domain-containing protein [Bacillota bacterium]HPM63260.1 ATP-binding cassette domain-containing protein [Bacillota bacterium]